jgi:alpha-D-ribose 1-methylphosphonate 5-triphosphate synthase subunit PhnH
VKALSPGFANPVFDCQAVFKSVLMAMARPGEVNAIKPVLTPPAPLTPAAAAVALTVLDYETLVWLDAALAAASEAVQWIKFHTGARIAAEPGEAAFALISDPANMPPITVFTSGTLEFPDRSATLILQVENIGDGEVFVLSGPGLASTQKFSAAPLPRNIATQLVENSALFPCGVDLIFATPESIAALPRSTRIARKE